MLFSFPFLALVRRELVMNLRRVRLFLWLLASVGLCALICVYQWPDNAWAAVNMGWRSREMLNSLTAALLGGGLLFIPGLSASAIASEYEQGTFEQLRLTFVSNVGIVAGKLANVLGVYLLVCVSILPVMALALFLVGVDWAEIARDGFFIVSAGVFLASIGLLMGALLRRTVAATVAAYVVIAALLAAASFSVLYSRGGSAMRLTTDLALFGLVLAGGALLLTVVALERPKRAVRLRSTKIIDDVQALETRRKRFPYYLIDPLRRRPMIADGKNPVLVREMRAGVMRRMTVSIRIFYAATATFCVISIVGPLMMFGQIYARNMATVVVRRILVLESLLVILVCPILLVNAFSKERVAGSVDALRMTLLTPRQIVMGKLGGALSIAVPVLLAVTVGLVPLGLLTFGFGGSARALLMGYPTLLVCTWYAVCAGLTASVLTKRTGTSLLLSYLLCGAAFAGLGGLMCAVTLLGLGLLNMVYPMRDVAWLWQYVASRAETLAELTSPIVSYWQSTESGRGFLYGARFFRWIVGCVFFIGLGWALVWRSVLHYRRRHMRDR